MSELTNQKPSRGRTFSPLRVMLGVLIAILFLFYLLNPHAPRRSSPRISCMANLKQLGVAFSLYAEQHNGVFPPADQWCDVLAKIVDRGNDSGRVFKCPTGGAGRCHYAMNPRATPQSASAVVLLFESAAGWNQSGGSEQLTMEHHTNKAGSGCNVLFVDFHVEFIKADHIPRLKWEGERSQPQGTQPPGQPK